MPVTKVESNLNRECKPLHHSINIIAFACIVEYSSAATAQFG
ncbi:MAG: hypothetical protein U0892_19780 [Pirellulales bacterium]